MGGAVTTPVYPTINPLDLGPARTESSTPTQYKLGRKPDGELVLQGLYFWHQGKLTGYIWRDIETVELA